MKIDRRDNELRAVLISSRSGEHPFESVSYEAGLLSLKIKRQSGNTEAEHFYRGRWSGPGLEGSVTVGGRESAGTWRASRK